MQGSKGLHPLHQPRCLESTASRRPPLSPDLPLRVTHSSPQAPGEAAAKAVLRVVTPQAGCCH